MLIDLRSKGVTGKEAENALVKADITINKNMVPFDDKSPFVTSGIRIGTSAMTSRNFGTAEFTKVFEWVDQVISDPTNETKIADVKKEVNQYMENYPLYPELS